MATLTAVPEPAKKTAKAHETRGRILDAAMTLFRRDGYDEVFCVLSGHATIQIDGTDGPGQSFDLRHGSVLLTPAGLTGRWLVHETIRKAYTIVHR